MLQCAGSNDDTGMKVLKMNREPGDKRTGTFTSGIVSTTGQRKIALYAVPDSSSSLS